MNKKLNLETKVGLFFVVVIILIAWISLKLGNYDLGERGGYTLEAVFISSAGLDPESVVLMAGIRVGRIESIRLHDGKALILMRIKDDIQVPDDSYISIQSKGFLGARFLEIYPGESSSVFTDGQRFENLKGSGDLNAVTGDIQDIAKDIKEITANLREIFGTPDGEAGMVEIFENLQRISTSLGDAMEENQRNFGKLVANLERFTSNMAYLSAKNRTDLERAMAAFPAIAENMKIISQNLAVILEKNSGDIGQSFEHLAEATAKLDKAMQSVQSIVSKIDEGEGTIGKLVNDDETVDNLNEAVTGINEFLTRVQQLQAEIAYKAEYAPIEGNAKSIFNLTLRPRKDKFYMLGIVDSPSGRTRTTDTVTETVSNPGGVDEKTTVTEEHKEVTSDTLKLNAMLGKRWYDIVFRGGLLESSAGFGVDYLLWDDQINLSFEAFDFEPDNNPVLKSYLDFTLFKHFVFTAGSEDFINLHNDPRWFFGGGIKITDDDISILFSKVPMPDM